MKILVGLSGGVDSATAAALLQRAGHDLTAVTMQICGGGSGSTLKRRGCYGAGKSGDIDDARKVAAHLGIPFKVLDLSREYEKEVLEEFRAGYAAGRTPNPCVRCNPRIKFGALLDEARAAKLEFDRFATGHYANVEFNAETGRFLLKKATDGKKDQSYFLSFLNQRQISLALFPLGGYAKAQVRKMAAEMGLPVSDKPESQDFASGGCDDIFPNTPPGPVMDVYGRMLGEHRGISHYTIGQRKGLCIPGGDKLYVVRIVPESNAIIVSDEDALMASTMSVTNLNWIAVEKPAEHIRAEVKIRSSAAPAAALLHSPQADRMAVTFDCPQRGIAPGQAAVFYQDDIVLGAGIIANGSQEL
ncbi:MAG: tRNA 2-thiouridine(34) synthase MnmA [Dehalococcoidia bacterium]|nr:tRNA 2-thiouridine(34) synthase MnmA [Dehalococcoidia bacterium]